MHVSNSVIAINRQSAEVPVKSQMDQKNGLGNDVFGNLLKQKLTSKSSSVSEVKVDDSRKISASKDLQARRMNKPQINNSGPSNTLKQPTEQKVEDTNTNQIEGSTEANKNAKVDATQKESEVIVEDTLEAEPVLDEEAIKETLAQLMPLLNLITLIPNELTGAVEGNEDTKSSVISQLVAKASDINDKLTALLSIIQNMPSKEKAHIQSDVSELTQQLNTLFTKVLEGTQGENVKVDNMKQLIEKLDNLTHLLGKVQEQVVKTQDHLVSTNNMPIDAIDPNKTTTAATNAKMDQNAENESKQQSFSEGKAQFKALEKADTKSSTTTTHHINPNEFQAKMESASVAFNAKVDVPQTGKMTLQQLVVDQLTNVSKMQVRTTETGTVLSMKLNPEVLGNVEIKLEIVKNVLQAEINVENMIVKGAIESNLSDLKNALSDKGYEVEQLSVSVGDKQSNNQGRQQSSQQQASRWQVDDLDEKDIRTLRIKDLTEATLSYLG